MIINPDLHNEYMHETLKAILNAQGILEIPEINQSWDELKELLVNDSQKRALDSIRSMMLVIGEIND